MYIMASLGIRVSTLCILTPPGPLGILANLGNLLNHNCIIAQVATGMPTRKRGRIRCDVFPIVAHRAHHRGRGWRAKHSERGFHWLAARWAFLSFVTSAPISHLTTFPSPEHRPHRPCLFGLLGSEMGNVQHHHVVPMHVTLWLMAKVGLLCQWHHPIRQTFRSAHGSSPPVPALLLFSFFSFL